MNSVKEMSYENKSNYIVRSQKLAGFLMTKGFKLHKIEPSFSNPKINVFVFTNSDQLLKIIEEYKNTK